MFITYSVGRQKNCDIQIEHDSISRKHLEITMTTNDRIFAVDCATTSGTFIYQKQQWRDFTQGYLKLEDQIALGKKKVIVWQILEQVSQIKPNSAIKDTFFDPVSIKPRRNSSTGEIELD
jgi:pSer/pThr/pTyr-binding forkhead associated (FHA) protein